MDGKWALEEADGNPITKPRHPVNQVYTPLQTGEVPTLVPTSLAKYVGFEESRSSQMYSKRGH